MNGGGGLVERTVWEGSEKCESRVVEGKVDGEGHWEVLGQRAWYSVSKAPRCLPRREGEGVGSDRRMRKGDGGGCEKCVYRDKGEGEIRGIS